MGKTHKPSNVNVLKTHVLQNDCVSYLCPCPKMFQIKESDGYNYRFNTTCVPQKDNENTNIHQLGEFNRTKDDDKPALSV